MNWNDDDLDLALRGLREEQAPDAVVSALRARVMADVSQRRTSFRRWGWRWALVPVAAAMVIAAALVWSPREKTQPSPVEVAQTPDSVAKPAPDETKPISMARVVPDKTNPISPDPTVWAAGSETKPIRRDRPVRRLSDETKPILRASVPRVEATETPGLVRIASSDPNILILWSLDDTTHPVNASESSDITANEGDSDQ